MYSKNIVFPTKLTYEETYPIDSNYKTPDSIKFLRNFDFSKEYNNTKEL